MTINPIETRYAGCRFRSRLEARWAVLLDTLGVRWDYEPEGYALNGGAYLPDFRLPEVCASGGTGVWFEVKPDEDLPDDPRWSSLCEGSGSSVVVAYGLPRTEDRHDLLWTQSGRPHMKIFTREGVDFPFGVCACRACGLIGIEFSGFADRLVCDHAGGREFGDEARVSRAYVAARSKRFGR